MTKPLAQCQGLALHQFAQREDNYTYILEGKKELWVIDPSLGPESLASVEALRKPVAAIFNTHQHGDHTGGNALLKERFHCPVYTSAFDRARITTSTHTVAAGDSFLLEGLTLEVIDTPGHTAGHITYWLRDGSWLFPGDTLFGLGCGRLFEGTPDVMWASLLKLRALPDDTLVCCAHEYTQSNLKFARTFPLPDLESYADVLSERLKQDGRTVPSRLGDEKRWNPFLLADQPCLASYGSGGAEIFAHIRKLKDNF